LKLKNSVFSVSSLHLCGKITHIIRHKAILS